MRSILVAIIAVLTLLAPASAAPPKLPELASTDAVMRWMAGYRANPDPATVPVAVRVLSRNAAFKDPETSGSYVGFVAGILAANPARAEELIGKMLVIRGEDHWVIVRAIAFSGLPNWKHLLRKYAHRMPTRQVMIDKYVAGHLPTLFELTAEKSPTVLERMRNAVSFSNKSETKPATLDSSPEWLDTFWGYYYATGTYRPISRVVSMLPWSKDNDNVEKLTIGSMAKYTLVSNAARDAALLGMLKRERDHYPKEVVVILDEVINAADTVDTARVRKEALASIEEIKRKGPGYRRNVSFWGQVGQGALALGCIAAAATGHIELGLPCVVGGGASSAAMYYWNNNP